MTFHADLDRLAAMGFDWVWFLSVCAPVRPGNRFHAVTTNGARNSRRRCRTCARKTSPGPVSPSLATRCIRRWVAMRTLARLRQRLRQRGLCLTLDFVPNPPLGLITPGWRSTEYYISGTELDLAQASATIPGPDARAAMSCWRTARDPYFPTARHLAQLNMATRPRRQPCWESC